MKKSSLLQKADTGVIISHMIRKKFLAIICLLVFISLLSCGQKIRVDETVTRKDVTLPASFEVVDVKTDGAEFVISVKKDDLVYQFVVTDDAAIYYNSGTVSKALLKKGQEVYVSGEDADSISSIIITNWPGMVSVSEKPMVKTEYVNVTVLLSNYLFDNHPELGIIPDSKWILDDSISVDDPPNHVDFYRFDRHILVIKWREHDFPDYNMMLVSHLEGAAYWSGRLNEYGEFEESFYEAQ